MIVRMWHGRVKHEDAATYRKFLRRRAIPDYRAVDGNTEVRILERRENDATHFVTMTTWTDVDAIRAFAGDDVEAAKYYPEDANYLLEFEPYAVHYELAAEG